MAKEQVAINQIARDQIARHQIARDQIARHQIARDHHVPRRLHPEISISTPRSLNRLFNTSGT